MLQIVLIRPGTTDYDLQDRIQGNLDIPLNEQGMADATRVAEELRSQGLDALYASTSEPALQTAKTLARSLGLRLRRLDRMQNLNHGLWQGMTIKDVRYKQPKVYRQWQEQPELVCPPEGEMLSAAEERVQCAMLKLLKKHKEGVVGICVSEPLLSLVRRFFVGGELGDLWKPKNGYGCLEVLRVEPEELLAINN
ncbi:MAG: histidine phosphatase family protein [Thermoguttaceae bacterium]